jgi:hypothetical protein
MNAPIGSTPRIFLGIPCYSAFTVQNTPAILNAVRCPNVDVAWTMRSSSLLTWNFNMLWCEALNRRSAGFTHFLLLHADVEPLDENWLDLLVEEMRSTRTEVLSAVVSIKDANGQTSTARDTDAWHPRRYTMQEVRQQPVTWTERDLLVNTGCLLVDMRRPWVERICFTINDRIARTPTGWEAVAEPEDWHFSRQCRRLNVPVWATRRIRIRHHGGGLWMSP